MTEARTGTGLIRKMMPYTTALLVIVVLYTAWVFYSRWRENRQAAANAEAARKEDARKVVEELGGNEVKLLSFNATPGAIHRGQTAQVCYGVSNATTVTIEPKLSEPVWPSQNRCIDVSPTETTQYTLVAEGANGDKKTYTLTLTVE